MIDTILHGITVNCAVTGVGIVHIPVVILTYRYPLSTLTRSHKGMFYRTNRTKPVKYVHCT